MNLNTATTRLKTFSVRVGHWQIVVHAQDTDAAIQAARQQLSRELPRLYDLIRSLTASRFQVESFA